MELTAREIESMRRLSVAYMPDTVTLMKRSDTTGAYGEQVSVFTTYATYRCGFAFSPFKFRSRETVGIGEAQSEILVRARGPQAMLGHVDPEDVIVLTHKYDEELDPHQTYQVQGFPEIIPTGIILNLRRTVV